MLARGNGDEAERVARARGRAEWGERQYPGWKDGDEVAREARFLPVGGEERADERDWKEDREGEDSAQGLVVFII